MLTRKSVMLIMAAPSGAGKSTLARSLLAAVPDLALSCSFTTRAPRPGEQHGKDYCFVDDATFDRMIEDGEFVEWFPVHDNRYGTSRQVVQQALDAGQDLLFDVDIEGAAALKRAFPQAASVFILPPSLEVLAERLRGRGSEDEQVVALRLSRVRRELEQAHTFDYLVVNDELEQAERELIAIYQAEGCASWRRQRLLESLLQPGA